jgi:hypothetical protein
MSTANCIVVMSDNYLTFKGSSHVGLAPQRAAQSSGQIVLRLCGIAKDDPAH